MSYFKNIFAIFKVRRMFTEKFYSVELPIFIYFMKFD